VVLAGASFSAWLVLITSCQQRVAILVRSRAGQAEAEAAASSSARSSFFVGKKIACGAAQKCHKKNRLRRRGGALGRSI
jgi:hypothetical protein